MRGVRTWVAGVRDAGRNQCGGLGLVLGGRARARYAAARRSDERTLSAAAHGGRSVKLTASTGVGGGNGGVRGEGRLTAGSTAGSDRSGERRIDDGAGEPEALGFRWRGLSPASWVFSSLLARTRRRRGWSSISLTTTTSSLPAGARGRRRCWRFRRGEGVVGGEGGEERQGSGPIW